MSADYKAAAKVAEEITNAPLFSREVRNLAAAHLELLELEYVAHLERTLAAQRTALLALFDEAERTGSQGIAVRGREIIG